MREIRPDSSIAQEDITMKKKMKTSVLQLAPIALGLILTGFITGCSSGDGGPKGGVIDACTLLAEMHPETLLGGPVDEGKKNRGQT